MHCIVHSLAYDFILASILLTEVSPFNLREDIIDCSSQVISHWTQEPMRSFRFNSFDVRAAVMLQAVFHAK